MTTTTIITAIVVMLAVVILLVTLLLVLRNKLLPTGNVTITINDDKQLEVPTGNSLISTLAQQQIYLPSACGGKGSCGQCKCRVLSGGGSILPTEVGFFTRKQQQEGWRLGCQVKVKEDMKIALPPSVLSIKKYECTVVSNRNVATFIKEFKVQLPPGEHMDFEPGSYAQIEIPRFDIKYADFDRTLITDTYLPAWEKNHLFDLRCTNSEPTTRAYSMANYPAEGDVFMLTVRIATPPFKPDRSGFMNVNPGIASSYIFSLKPGDKVTMSGPYGEFHIKQHPEEADSVKPKVEMIWVGGGAGMAPLRAQIMHMTRTLHTTDRPMHYFYGARALNEGNPIQHDASPVFICQNMDRFFFFNLLAMPHGVRNLVPRSGSDPYLLHWQCSFNHWTREVQWTVFKKEKIEIWCKAVILDSYFYF